MQGQTNLHPSRPSRTPHTPHTPTPTDTLHPLHPLHPIHPLHPLHPVHRTMLQESQILKMAAAVVVASPVGAHFERSVLRGIYPGRANEVDRCLNSKGVRRHGTDY